MLSRIINEFMSIIFFWTRAPKFRLSTRSYIRIAVLLAMLAVLTHGCGEPLWDSETAEIYGLSYKYLDNAVNEISPPNEASSVTTSTAIYVTFNHPMDKGSVEENFSLTPSAPGTFHWTDRFHFQYVPQNELAHDTTYTIQILSQASDVHGKIMASTFSSTFSTPSDNPSVFKVDPADGEDKVSPSDDIRITFNEPVDRQSATLAFALSPAIPGVFSWDDSDRTLVYNPDTALSMGTVYTITISTAIKDLVGNHMDSTFTSSFTTLEAYETERPVIVSIATMDEVTIHVLFSEPLDRYSAELPQHYDIAGLGVTAAGRYQACAKAFLVVQQNAQDMQRRKLLVPFAHGQGLGRLNEPAQPFGIFFEFHGNPSLFTTHDMALIWHEQAGVQVHRVAGRSNNIDMAFLGESSRL